MLKITKLALSAVTLIAYVRIYVLFANIKRLSVTVDYLVVNFSVCDDRHSPQDTPCKTA